MTSGSESYFSIKMTRFLMLLTGIWAAENKREQTLLKWILYYSAVAMIIAIVTTGVDFYFALDDFYDATYNSCALMPVIVCFLKITGFLTRRSMVLRIIRYTRDNFWDREYDEFGKETLRETDRKGILLICSFAFFVCSTCLCYITNPLIENIGKNDSDRILAFHVWLNVPTGETPYYEIFSTTQAFSCVHSGICFCGFDSLFCMLNMHVAAQFKILQHQIATICDASDFRKATAFGLDNESFCIDDYSDDCHEKLKNCVQKHQALIRYVEDLEKLFTFVVLGQLVVSSIMLCTAGFQVSQEQAIGFRRLIFVAHTMASMFQLLVITVTADEIIVESGRVGVAAYVSFWNYLPYDCEGKKLREGLVMIIRRSQKPCSLTAGKFFPVSLETFTKVITTSMSYYTVLRQMEQDISEN